MRELVNPNLDIGNFGKEVLRICIDAFEEVHTHRLGDVTRQDISFWKDTYALGCDITGTEAELTTKKMKVKAQL